MSHWTRRPFWILTFAVLLLPAGAPAQAGDPAGSRTDSRTGSRAGSDGGPDSGSVSLSDAVFHSDSVSHSDADSAAVPDWLFPDRALLPTLMAGPRDPVTTGQLVYDWENPTAFGPGVAGEVAISGGVAVARLAGSGPEDALVVGLEGAAFARFSFKVVTRELVNTDWFFAVPLVWHRGRHWFRFRYFHTSSHLGDEYQNRYGPSSINFSRDGGDVTAYVRPAAAWARRAGLAVYGLVFWSVNSHPEERGLWEARAGLELDPGAGALWQPFATVDVHAEEGVDWRARTTVQAGIWLPRVEGRPLRAALQATVGPSPLGQFRTRDVGRVAFGLFWNP